MSITPDSPEFDLERFRRFEKYLNTINSFIGTIKNTYPGPAEIYITIFSTSGSLEGWLGEICDDKIITFYMWREDDMVDLYLDIKDWFSSGAYEIVSSKLITNGCDVDTDDPPQTNIHLREKKIDSVK